MNKIKTGGQAFPTSPNEINEYGVTSGEDGMTLRDYFAAKAMQGMVATGITVDIHKDIPFQQRAEVAYMIADAMLAVRLSTQEQP